MVTAWLISDDYGVYNSMVSTTNGSDGYITMTEVGTGKLRARLGSVAGNLGTDTVPLGIWTHIAFVFDRNGNADGYIDGDYVGSLDISSQSLSIDTPHAVRIGRPSTK